MLFWHLQAYCVQFHEAGAYLSVGHFRRSDVRRAGSCDVLRVGLLSEPDVSVTIRRCFCRNAPICQIFSAAGHRSVFDILSAAVGDANQRVSQRLHALSQMVRRFLAVLRRNGNLNYKTCRKPRDHQRPFHRLDQHRKYLDVRRSAGYDEQSKNQ